MAKLTGPQFSLTASGQFGKAIVYTRWRGTAVSRQLVTPRNPRSMPQRARRAMMGCMAALWTLTSDSQKALWKAAGVSYNLPGFQTFTKFGLNAYTKGYAPANEPGSVPTIVDDAVTGLSVGQTGSAVTVSFTPSATATNFGSIVVASVFVPTVIWPEEIVAVEPPLVDQAYFTLPQGTWHIAVAPFDEDGLIGEIAVFPNPVVIPVKGG